MTKKIHNADRVLEKQILIKEGIFEANCWYGGDYIEVGYSYNSNTDDFKYLALSREQFETLYAIMTELKKEIEK